MKLFSQTRLPRLIMTYRLLSWMLEIPGETMAELDIAVIPLLKDNYGYLIHDAGTGKTAALDPSVAAPMLDAAKERGWRISHILNTHHHWDHTDGNLGIKEATGAIV